MAARLEETLGASTALLEGSGGIFDVRVDEKLVYSKHETGEFPDEESLANELAATV